jgi:predicted phage baseplate assembly protein
VTRADPLEEGVGDLPPAINDPAIAARVVTWIRLQAHAASDARILWAGVNAATVTQRRHVRAEALTAGTGEPDQRRTLAFAPVLDGSVALTVAGTPFAEIADLVDAGPEVLVPDPRAQPGAEPPAPAPADAFALDPATGTVTFGDGRRGRRPAAGAEIRADYDATMGAAGNLAAGQVTAGPDLPAGMTVTNPVPTWGGADPEPIDEAERHVARYVQHRDRLVTAEDVDAIARRTPGVRVGRVDVLPGYDPSLGAMPPGDAAGCITVMVVPASDPAFPLTPQPDQAFLDAVCAYLSPRRLATTELFVRGPVYVGLWVTIGYDPEPGRSLADLERALRTRLERYLAAIDPGAPPWPALPPSGTPRPRIGWPLGTPVDRLALVAEADRVEGINYVSDLRLAGGDGGEAERVPLAGLQLPRLLGVLAAPGAAPDIDGVRGLGGGGGAPTMPVPIVPGEC